jgi:segregation and condensation protein B
MEQLAQHIEAVIFSTEHAISLKEIHNCLEETFGLSFNNDEVKAALAELQQRYRDGNFAFEILEIADGYQFMTKPAYHNIVGTYLKQVTKKRLSKSELEGIRGVSCDYSIQKLLEKELIAIAGRSDAPGRPLLYSTSGKFMDYFGLRSMKDLPKTKDFKNPDSEVGEAGGIDEAK